MSQRVAAAEGTGVLVRLPVRWIVLFTGSKASEDYQPASSAGESAALIKEVTDICVALHPHTEIRLFPQNGEVVLFYQSRETGERIVTRVTTAPNPDGVRTSLEYCSVILPDPDFRRIHADPFAIVADGLHDQVREQFLGGSSDPVLYAPSGRAPESSGARTTPADDLQATPDNVGALRAMSAKASAAGEVPPSFATWWSSTGPAPEGYFDYVLRAVPSRVLTLREAIDNTAALATDVKGALPSAPATDTISVELIRNVLACADAAHRAVAEAGAKLDSESPARFREHLVESARQAGQLAGDIGSLIGRLSDGLGASDRAALEALAERSREIERDVTRVRHPNPFAQRRVTAPAGMETAGGASNVAPADKAANQAAWRVIPVAAAVVAMVGGGALLLHRSSDSSAPPARSAKNGHPLVPVRIAAPVAAARPVDPAVALITQYEAKVQASATQAAHDVARQAALAAATPPTETQIEQWASDAITAGCQKTIPPDQYASGLATGAPWSYARYKKTAPALAYAVHEAATVGVTEGVAGRKLKAVEAAVPKPSPSVAKVVAAAPTPEPTPRADKPKRRLIASDATPKPRPTKRHAVAAAPAPAATAAASSGGSAAQSGL